MKLNFMKLINFRNLDYCSAVLEIYVLLIFQTLFQNNFIISDMYLIIKRDIEEQSVSSLRYIKLSKNYLSLSVIYKKKLQHVKLLFSKIFKKIFLNY